MNIPAALKALEPDMLQWRHFLHQHPELQFDVHTTADFIVQKLESFGLEVTRQVGRTGLVASLRKGTDDAAIALRADMDALPIIEANDFAHKPTHQGQMHACGHDGHSTMLLGAAAFLTQHVDFSGTV